MLKSGTIARFEWVHNHIGVLTMRQQAADRTAKSALYSGSEVDMPYTVSAIGGMLRQYFMLN